MKLFIPTVFALVLLATIVPALSAQSDYVVQPVRYREMAATPRPPLAMRLSDRYPGPLMNGGETYTLCMPLFYYNYGPTVTPAPTPIPTWAPGSACSDPNRGPLYREMVSGTLEIIAPIAEWASDWCCDLDIARYNGYYLGTVLSLIPTILGKVIGVIISMIASTLTYIGQIVGLITGDASSYSVSCDADAELFCLGLAAVISLDSMAGGWLSAITGLVIAILTFYLAMWVISQVRDIMQPGAGDNT